MRLVFSRAMENRSFSDAGGTPGGLGEFVIGFIMVCLGGYFLANQVSVVGSYWSFYGTSTLESRSRRCSLAWACCFGKGRASSAGY